MEDICSKLQEIRNPIHAIGLLIREMDYETEVEMERDSIQVNDKAASAFWFRKTGMQLNF